MTCGGRRPTSGNSLISACSFLLFTIGVPDVFHHARSADHFVGVDEGYRPHVDEKCDSLLIASLGEKTSGLGKDPVILSALVVRPFVIRHASYLAALL